MPLNQLISLRKELHQNPEIAGEEGKTATKILSFFSELKPSLIVDDQVVEFTNFEKTYILKESPDFVWDSYKFSDQTDVWDINRVSFGMLFCRGTQSIVYADQIFYGMEKGQIYFINLKILNGPH